MLKCDCPDCRAERRCRKKCDDHHSYHHDYSGSPHPHPNGAYKSVASLSATLISPFDLSKDPNENTAIAGVMVGSCAPAGNIFPALRALAANVACLADLVGASDAPQFDDVYQFRKYEGDAPCVLVLKPTPCVYVLSTVEPAPAENVPDVVRDCLGRAWTAVTSDYGCADAVANETTGKTRYTFQQFYGDGIPVPDAKPFSFELPTINGVPDCPPKTSDDDDTRYWLTCSGCVNDGAFEWMEIPCASTTEKGLVQLATTEQAEAGTADDVALTPAGAKALLGQLSFSDANAQGVVTVTCGSVTIDTFNAGSGGSDTGGGDTGGGDTGGGDTGGGDDTCPADADGVVRPVGDTVVQWTGDWVDGDLSSTPHGTPPGAPPSTGGVIAMQPPFNQTPNARGYAGSWTSGAEDIVQDNDENVDLACRLWTKQSC